MLAARAMRPIRVTVSGDVTWIVSPNTSPAPMVPVAPRSIPYPNAFSHLALGNAPTHCSLAIAVHDAAVTCWHEPEAVHVTRADAGPPEQRDPLSKPVHVGVVAGHAHPAEGRLP